MVSEVFIPRACIHIHTRIHTLPPPPTNTTTKNAPRQVDKEVEVRQARQEGPRAGVEPAGRGIQEGRRGRDDVRGVDPLLVAGGLLLRLGGVGRAEKGLAQRLIEWMGVLIVSESPAEEQHMAHSPALTSSSARGGPARLKSPPAPAPAAPAAAAGAARAGVVMARGRVRKAASTSWRVSPETNTSLFKCWVSIVVMIRGKCVYVID